MADKKETAFPGAQELLLLIENLQDALLKVEWVCMGTNPRRFACAFCGGVSIKDGGDDHADDCEWCRLVRITPSEALGVSSQQERSGWQDFRETVTLVTNSMGDVVTLGRFAKSVDPIRLVSDWHHDLCLAIHKSLREEQAPLPVSVSGTPEQDKGR
jgi:hypothetical protein